MFKTSPRGLFIVISGPTSAGKGTIIKQLRQRNHHIWLSVSMTTRNSRPNEVDGQDYYFVTEETFLEKIKKQEFLEYAKVHSHYYGTPKGPINEYLQQGIDVILEIDIQGALQIKNNYPEGLFIFILPPSMEELKQRLIARGTEDETKRLERFKRAYEEINEVTQYNYVVINDQLEEAVAKVEAIMLAEKCRVDRIEGIVLNSKEEAIHENLLVGKFMENKDFKIE